MRKKEDENKIEFYEISNFKFYLEDDMGSPINTVNAYISDLRQYQDFLVKYENINDVSEITREDILRYIESLKRTSSDKELIYFMPTIVVEELYYQKFLLNQLLKLL